MVYDLTEFLSLDNDIVLNFKGRYTDILTVNGEIISGTATGFGLATNPPHLVCSIEINGYRHIPFQTISKIEI